MTISKISAADRYAYDFSMPIILWLQCLPPSLYRKVMRNAKAFTKELKRAKTMPRYLEEEYLCIEVDTFYIALATVFLWGESPEGKVYWQKIGDKYNKLFKTPSLT